MNDDYSENDLKDIAVELLSKYRKGFPERIKLKELVDDIFKGYLSEEKVPYHNFRHAVDVAQMTYFIIRYTKMRGFDRFNVIFAALCHDLGHFGIPTRLIAEKPESDFYQSGRDGLKREFPELPNSHLEFFHTQRALRLIDDHFTATDKGFQIRAKKVTKLLILATDRNYSYFFNHIISNGYSGDTLRLKVEMIPKEALLCIKVSIFELFVHLIIVVLDR